MGLDQADILLTATIVLGIMSALIGLIWFFLKDQNPGDIAFVWMQLPNSIIRAEYIDRTDTKWILDIKYHSKVILPSCRREDNHKLIINIPDDYSVKEFERFVAKQHGKGPTFKLLRGLFDCHSLNRLHFASVDIKLFGDFKKAVFHKALTP